MIDQSTICAISSPPGVGAIAMIRLSGEKAITIADNIFKSVSNKKLKDQAANTLHFGNIVEDNNVIDEVVASIFRTPHSFTGENIVEISCHGSTYIQQKILNLCIHNGARLANPGEFTQRAFLNGKMDLSQAEAVADIIASSNSAAHKMALQQMRGGYSDEIKDLREQLLHFAAMIELELDFSEEDVEFADRKQLKDLTLKIKNVIGSLKDSFQLGNAIKNGIPVAIVGETNVGKSTLLNALLNEEKAIVSDIHGTTRDVIEDTVNINGQLFRFFDTAGIRETTDSIEKIGIERTLNKFSLASIILLIIDLQNDYALIENRINQTIELLSNQQKLIIVGNKTDLSNVETIEKLKVNKVFNIHHLQLISAKQKTGVDTLKQQLINAVELNTNQSDIIVSNVRHYEILKLAYESIERVWQGLETGITHDFLAQDIRECVNHLSQITGEISTDQVLGHIFKNFCIGK